ncbi:TetR/AcrR family transcriptional regulator [Arthrobacter rhombi]|uniref:TetR/AcrR family transcriptional regulator n=1 Tax=Arthrobacter rhombi TaxID=71253 RepID=UPI0031D55DCA
MSEFADAALRIVGRDGMVALSFRAVAAEAGWSLGAVQKAFATKQELLLAALERAQVAVVSEVTSRPARPDLRTWLGDLIMETLPFDDARRAAVVVGIAFSDRAPFDAEIAAILQGQSAGVREQLVRLLEWRRADGELRAALDDAAIARALLAFAGGLAAELIYTPADPGSIDKLVRDTVDALLRP